MDERSLIDTLRKIEALHSGATTEGERVAAERARERILERLRSAERVEPAIEYRLSLHDPWHRRVFLALARRYGLKPYRTYGQHQQTVMLRVPKRFLDETLWPEYVALVAALDRYLVEVTDRVIGEAIHQDSSEAEERPAIAGPTGGKR